jgi:hypothetical protein
MEYGIKKLYDVQIKAFSPQTIGGIAFDAGETILEFDEIDLSRLEETKTSKSARGGFNNQELVNWTSTTDVTFSISRGKFTPLSLAILTNANLFTQSANTECLIDIKETLITNSNKQITLSELPANDKIFIYNSLTNVKITNWTISNKTVTLSAAELEVIVRYQYDYNNAVKILEIGKQMFSGIMSLVGKTKLKDDETGAITSAIVTIPKLRIASSLSINFGNYIQPSVNNFYIVALPIIYDGQKGCVETITFLQEEI